MRERKSDSVDELLTKLAGRLQSYDGAEIVTARETAEWSDGKLDELVKMGVLTEIPHANGFVCDECEEGCFAEPDIRTHPETGAAMGVFGCHRREDIGRIEVDLDRLRLWRINAKKLKILIKK